MRAIVTYVKKQVFQIDAENAYDAANQAEKNCPDGFELSDWNWESEEECIHPRSEREYIGMNMLRCKKCWKEFS